MTISLDPDQLNRAVPPGSMRYFAWLYTPTEKRDAIAALFLIDAEIRESAQSANHDVAHTRLQWWRQEIDRLVNNNAQHPATRALAASATDHRPFSKLHELIAAADMDLARMTYLNDQELRAYCSRSGGSIAESMALQMAAPTALDEATRSAANTLGALIRTTEIIRDVRQDAYDGRLYLPLEALAKRNLKHDDFRPKNLDDNARGALRDIAARTQNDIERAIASIPTASSAYLRPLYVLAALHAGLIGQMARSHFDVGVARIELGPVRKPWLAWRAARRAR